MTGPNRFFDLLAVVGRHRVEFVLIGGFALAFHGVVRATKDVDIVPEPSVENLTRLWEALVELEARPGELGALRPEELPLAWSRAGLIGGGGNWILDTRLGRIDVMQWVKGIDSYADLRAAAVEQDVPEIGFRLIVAGFDDLVTMKEEAGRDQDLIDVTALRMARGLEE